MQILSILSICKILERPEQQPDPVKLMGTFIFELIVIKRALRHAKVIGGSSGHYKRGHSGEQCHKKCAACRTVNIACINALQLLQHDYLSGKVCICLIIFHEGQGLLDLSWFPSRWPQTDLCQYLHPYDAWMVQSLSVLLIFLNEIVVA